MIMNNAIKKIRESDAAQNFFGQQAEDKQRETEKDTDDKDDRYDRVKNAVGKMF